MTAAERTLRRDARRIFAAALKAADPAAAIQRAVSVQDNVLRVPGRAYPLARFQRIFVIGAGKATARMAQAVERILGARLSGGVVVVKYGHTAPLRRITLHEASHPVPDEAGQRGAQLVAECAAQAGPHDLVLCLLSGGASALLPAPAPPVTLVDKQETTSLLLRSGAAIHEINVVRKHLSQLKGGQLARLASPATLLSLLLSDVIGDDLDVIGSGPTAPDASTFLTAQEVLLRYGLTEEVPASVRERLAAGAAGELPETPKAGDAAFRRTRNLIIGSNRLAIEAAAETARALGYRPLILSTRMEGEAREVGRFHATLAREVALDRRPVAPPACLLSGGEPTVTLRGPGLGGRNQELALAAAIDLDGLENIVLLSGGTDGTDGPTDATGAIATGSTLSRARQQGLMAAHALAENDSYYFFDPLGDLLRTGPTGTNVMDVRIVLVGAPQRS